MQKYLTEMVEARRSAEVKEERYDLFSSLLDANEEELARFEVTDVVDPFEDAPGTAEPAAGERFVLAAVAVASASAAVALAARSRSG